MSDEYPFKCSSCGSSFAKQEFLDKHNENHTMPNMLEYSREILDAVDNLIKLTWPITREHLKQHGEAFDWSNSDQCMKIIEEVVEYQKEVMKTRTDKADWKQMDEENLDILFAWLTLQHGTNQNNGIDKFAMLRVLKKFEERGWLKF